jgi:DNA-binding HxlR family transcriptional regulator
LKPGNPQETGACRQVSEILGRVGDKWTVLVIMQLVPGPKRFNALRREIGGVSQKMLSATLRGLERDGFVARTVYPTVPPSVDYALTELGRELAVPVRALGEWVMDNLPRVEAARARYDGGTEAEEAPAEVRRAS